MVYVIYDSWIPRLLSIQGIVLYPFILIATPKKDTRSYIIKHELVHVKQITRIGCCRFYTLYIYSMFNSCFQKGNCYTVLYDNEFEDEAYEIEDYPLTKDEMKLVNWDGPHYGPRV